MKKNQFNFPMLLSIVVYILSTAGLNSQGLPPESWFRMNPANDPSKGVASEQTLSDLAKNKKGTEVIVAVIDGGTDIEHPDLFGNAWINPKEVAGNGIDDDANGYVDDVYGWDFIGGKEADVQYDNLELTRQMKVLEGRFGGKTSKDISASDKADFKRYNELKEIYKKKYESIQSQFVTYSTLSKFMEAFRNEIGSDTFTVEQAELISPKSKEAVTGKTIFVGTMKSSGLNSYELLNEIKDVNDYYSSQFNYHYNMEYNSRGVVGDDYNDFSQRHYGNAEVRGPEAEHGTHVAGIIAAVRNNGIGLDGVGNNVKIMVLRVVPDGDERDKDVGNAIRYAADNGARIINMSFGKSVSHNKAFVDEAVKYAQSKDVLMVHAAGNDAANIDKMPNFPNPVFLDGSRCNSWVEVGASQSDASPAPFSNYGKKKVDVFAPGVSIYSTIPDSKYKRNDGTSMASPVCAGVAAILRSYYPSLTAPQIREILMKSVEVSKGKYPVPGTKKKKAKYSKLCASGGIVNAYKAFQLAESYAK